MWLTHSPVHVLYYIPTVLNTASPDLQGSALNVLLQAGTASVIQAKVKLELYATSVCYSCLSPNYFISCIFKLPSCMTSDKIDLKE